MQTKVTSYVATHSRSDTSYNILKEERRELLEQVSASSHSSSVWGQAGAGRQHMAALLTEVVADTEMMHCRQKWAAEEHQYWAQDTELGRAAEQSSAEEGGVGEEWGIQSHRAGTCEDWSLPPAPWGSTVLVTPAGSPGPARAHGLPRWQRAAARRHP